MFTPIGRIVSVAAAAALVVGAAGAWPAGAASHRTARVSLGTAAGEANDGSFVPSASRDGRYVAFVSSASNLVPHDFNRKTDVFVRDTKTGETTRISVSSKGMQANDLSYNPSISDDGRFVAFDSFASNLVPGDLNRAGDVFVHDRVTRKTERISRGAGAEANGQSGFAVISGDGQHVAFESVATNIVPVNEEYGTHLFVWDREKKASELVDRAPAGYPGNGGSGDAALSRDGRFVAFASGSTNLVAGDYNKMDDVFLFDRQSRSMQRVSMTALGMESNSGSNSPTVSDDGGVVAFESLASNLLSTDLRSLDHIGLLPKGVNPHTAGDTNGVSDIFARDMRTGTIELLSVTTPGVQGTSASYGPSISGDGTLVAFTSFARNLTPGVEKSPGKHNEVFVRDRVARRTTLASVDDADVAADNASNTVSMSADGSAVVFSSSASNLVHGDRNHEADIFLRR